eukprot:1133811-Pelagomonas_calceolata.AAC.5
MQACASDPGMRKQLGQVQATLACTSDPGMRKQLGQVQATLACASDPGMRKQLGQVQATLPCARHVQAELASASNPGMYKRPWQVKATRACTSDSGMCNMWCDSGRGSRGTQVLLPAAQSFCCSTQSGQLACTLQVDMHGLGKVDPSRPSSGELRNNFGQHRATADFCWAPRVQQHQF